MELVVMENPYYSIITNYSITYAVLIGIIFMSCVIYYQRRSKRKIKKKQSVTEQKTPLKLKRSVPIVKTVDVSCDGLRSARRAIFMRRRHPQPEETGVSS